MIIVQPYYESEKFKNMNNEFKVNVDEQHDDIKHLKEYSDIYDIEPLWKEMDVCVRCNQIIAKKNLLKNHIQEKHTELLWNYSGMLFKLRMELTQSYGYSIWINLPWTTGKTGVNT